MPRQLTELRSGWDADQALPGELLRFYRGLFEQEMAGWPEEIRDVLIERHLSREWLQAGIQEAGNVDQLYDEVRHAEPMPDLPLIVLCSMEMASSRRRQWANPSRCCARRLKANSGSTPHGPDQFPTAP